ncbi:caprin-2 isoform X2 [Brienomyrus brachyistius]|uniref:caprin-2 isoform X2 n=1 Tax=Brienomyrus brachyistius TaxID=42636 RepID=UPI0020B31F61|nr:caprin-2 isoform X2 [Brienomyrus brachyistius]
MNFRCKFVWMTCKMVHQSSSSILDASSPSECSEEVLETPGSPRPDPPDALTSLQLDLPASTTTYQGYETYIENGLICLKHKIRNIEKKKLKLENYKKRIMNGESLNPDQLDAVETYEEVVHNLKFAKELQKTIGALSQDLLKAQKKAVRREQTSQMEAEKQRLCTVLQVHYILQNLQKEHTRKDFRSGLNGAPFLSARELEHLLELSTLLGCRRDESVSLQDQMEQVSIVYWDLLEGGEKPVAGTTYKHLKENLARLMDCEYFDHIPVPHSENLEEDFLESKNTKMTIKPQRIMSDLSTLMARNEATSKEFNRCYLVDGDFSGQIQPNKRPAPAKSWKADFLALKQQEPPDSWDMEFEDVPTPQPTAPQKPWRGEIGFVPKAQAAMKSSTQVLKERKVKKLKGQPGKKLTVKVEMPVEVFSSSSLPNDPVQREQELQELMEQIKGSFSFMQDSVLDSDGSVSRHSWVSSPENGPSSPIDLKSEVERRASRLPKVLHSTPLPPKSHPINAKTDLTNGDQSLDNNDLDLTADQGIHENVSDSSMDGFATQPLFHRESAVSISLAENSAEQVVNDASMPPKSDFDQKSDESVFSDSYNLNYTTASTQTPPDLDFDLEPLQPVTSYQSETPITNGCQMPMPPGQPVGALSYHAQPYYPRGSVRGGFEGFRAGIRSPRGSCPPRPHVARECAPVLYRVQEPGYQMNYNHAASGKRSKPRATWKNQSQVNSPERDDTFASADSGYSDSRCATPIDVPFTTQSPALVPIYPMRVAFSAACTANFVPSSLDQPIIFDVLHCNLGEAFDMHVGRFSCPVNGTYVFIFHILKLAIDVPLYVNLMKNDEVMVSAYANDCAPDHEMASNQAVLQLFQGDQVWLQLHRGAIYSSSWKYSTFSGFLLYQD